MVLAQHDVISATDLPFVRRSSHPSSGRMSTAAPATAEETSTAGDAETRKDEWSKMTYADAKKRMLARFDNEYTSELLKSTEGNMSEAARRAGLDRSNFRRLLKRRREDG